LSSDGRLPQRNLEVIMAARIDVRKLIRFETADDGSSIEMLVQDSAGRSASLSFPIECLTSLIMTLPGMVTSALQHRQKDPTLRVVFPLQEFDVELSSNLDTRILTLKTPDGFAVSFGLNEDQCRRIGCATPRRPKVQRRHIELN
jgi:hypothetical protein